LRLLPQTDNRKEIRGHCKRSGTWGVFVESVKQIKEACARIGVTLREALRLNEENWENERALDGLLKKSRG
jgi:hypothetical protein